MGFGWLGVEDWVTVMVRDTVTVTLGFKWEPTLEIRRDMAGRWRSMVSEVRSKSRS